MQPLAERVRDIPPPLKVKIQLYKSYCIKIFEDLKEREERKYRESKRERRKRDCMLTPGERYAPFFLPFSASSDNQWRPLEPLPDRLPCRVPPKGNNFMGVAMGQSPKLTGGRSFIEDRQ